MNLLKAFFIIFKFIFISIALIICSIAVIPMFLYDPMDTCLDSGYCKNGLSLHITGKKIIVNEQSCKENNGIWHENKKACQFK